MTAIRTIGLFICFCLSALAVTAARTDLGIAPGVYRYTYQVMGKKEGEQVTEMLDDGRIVVDFAFNDRGRGPELHAEMRLDADGLPIDYAVTGHSYMGGEVNEEFVMSDRSASWATTSERGETTVTAPSLYLSADGVPEELAIIARALLRRSDHTLPALPAGQVSVSQLRRVTLETERSQRDVILYAIDGIGLTPAYVWLDPDQQLFAMMFGWSSLVAEGWEAQAERLQREQDETDTERLNALAATLSHRYEKPVAIRNADLFDSENAKLIENVTVVVYRDRIGAVYTEPVELDEDVVVIDAAGMTVLPGLFDMHEHAAPWRSFLQIAGGVTSVRDLANNNAQLLDLVERIDTGQVIGPRIFRCGFIDQAGPYQGPGGKIVATLDEAIAAVEWYAQRGYRQIKLYSSIDPEWVAPIVSAAHARGLRVSGHIPSFMTAEQAVLDGYDEIQHINMIFLNFLAEPTDDTRTPIRFTAVGERAVNLDLRGEPVERFIALLRERGTVVDPTVTIFEDLFLNRSGIVAPPFAMVADHFPISMQREWLGATLDIDTENATTYAESFDALLAMIGILYDAGIPLVAGTDALAGFALHREFELYVRAGIPPAAVLKMATLDAARLLGADQLLGSVTPGKKADLILVEGDPSKNISDIRKIRLVMKSGVVYYPSELYRAVGIEPFTEPLMP